MARRLAAILSILALAFAVGCGGDDDGGDGGSPTTKDEAVERCLDRAKDIEDESARQTAEDACRGDREGVRESVEDQCLDAARQVPEGPARDRAEDACRNQSK